MWTEEILSKYIEDKVEENTHLDYKTADSLSKTDGKKKEISKDISAFANSDGGIIIYGIKEYDEKEKRHLPEKIVPINGVEFTKEWLEQTIQSNISPKIKNLIITPVRIGAITADVVYVVEIGKSDTAHQANDKKYYKRYNFESAPMDDWEIKDIINRKSKSNVSISIEPENDSPILRRLKDKINNDITFNVYATNNGNGIVKYIECYFSGEKELSEYINEPKIFKHNSGFEFVLSNEIERKLKINSSEVIISTERIAILPQTFRLLGKITLHSTMLAEERELIVSISTEDNYSKQVFKTNELIK